MRVEPFELLGLLIEVAAQGMAALAHVILANRTDVVDNDIPLILDVCGRENRGPARDDRHDGLRVVARREVGRESARKTSAPPVGYSM